MNGNEQIFRYRLQLNPAEELPQNYYLYHKIISAPFQSICRSIVSKRGDKWNLQKTIRKLIGGLERFDLSYSLLVEIKYYFNGIF